MSRPSHRRRDGARSLSRLLDSDLATVSVLTPSRSDNQAVTAASGHTGPPADMGTQPPVSAAIT